MHGTVTDLMKQLCAKTDYHLKLLCQILINNVYVMEIDDYV